MTNTGRVLLVIASLAIANAVSFFTLSRNLEAGLYPVEADSIGLPLMGGMVLSGLMLILLIAAILIPKRKLLGPTIATVLCIVSALLSGISAVAWVVPHHFGIAAAYSGVSVVCFILGVGYARTLASNKRSQPRPLRGPAAG